MPHKITLTGKPCSPLRVSGKIFSFDMEESGSPSAPKGLPASQAITYTVFLNQKQLSKAGLDEKNIQDHKLLVQGEPTLDIPVDECPGEIGVVCFQVSIVPSKEKETQKEEPAIQEVKQAMKEVAAAIENAAPVPEGTQDVIPLSSITVPEEFSKFKPNPKKTQVVIDFVKTHGYLDEPITVHKKTLVLKDGYRRYVVAQELNMRHVPVIYQ